jgi:hypothetical protein
MHLVDHRPIVLRSSLLKLKGTTTICSVKHFRERHPVSPPDKTTHQRRHLSL